MLEIASLKPTAIANELRVFEYCGLKRAILEPRMELRVFEYCAFKITMIESSYCKCGITKRDAAEVGVIEFSVQSCGIHACSTEIPILITFLTINLFASEVFARIHF